MAKIDIILHLQGICQIESVFANMIQWIRRCHDS